MEIGSEATPAAFLSTLLALTREWRRILAPHGSISVELGDTYSGSGGGEPPDTTRGFSGGTDIRTPATVETASPTLSARRGTRGWPLAKSLCAHPDPVRRSASPTATTSSTPTTRIEPWRITQPHRLASPQPARRRPRRQSPTIHQLHHHRLHVATSDGSTSTPNEPPRKRQPNYPSNRPQQPRPEKQPARRNWTACRPHRSNPAGAPPLDCWIDGDVWTIPTAPYKGAHYATYPLALPRRLIRLMCPRQVCVQCAGNRGEGSPRTNTELAAAKRLVGDRWQSGGLQQVSNALKVPTASTSSATQITLGWTDSAGPTADHANYRRGHVLDPFAGIGTTLIAAAEQGRDATGIDLDPRNLDLARQRIGLFLEEATT